MDGSEASPDPVAARKTDTVAHHGTRRNKGGWCYDGLTSTLSLATEEARGREPTYGVFSRQGAPEQDARWRGSSFNLWAPSCAMWFSGESTPLPTHSQPDGSEEGPLNPHHRLIRQTRFYHILDQAVPIQAHGCTVFMGGRSMNWSLDLGMMSTKGFWSSPDKPRTVGIHRTQFQTRHSKSRFFTLTGNTTTDGVIIE
jgi:hypothetical protein